MTNRAPYESHNVSGYRVDFFHGEDGAIVVEVPAIPGCITQDKDREEALTNAAEAIAVSVEPSIAQMVTAEAVKQLRAAADTLSERDATITRLTAERDVLYRSALAGIEAVTKSNQALREAAASIAQGDAEIVRLTADVERLRIACNEARSAVVDFNDEDDVTDLGIHEADGRDVAMGNAWRILDAALGDEMPDPAVLARPWPIR